MKKILLLGIVLILLSSFISAVTFEDCNDLSDWTINDPQFTVNSNQCSYWQNPTDATKSFPTGKISEFSINSLMTYTGTGGDLNIDIKDINDDIIFGFQQSDAGSLIVNYKNGTDITNFMTYTTATMETFKLKNIDWVNGTFDVYDGNNLIVSNVTFNITNDISYLSITSTNLNMNQQNVIDTITYEEYIYPFFDTYAYDVYDSNLINNYSIELDGYKNFSTTNGYILTDKLLILNQTYNVTFWNASGYSNRTYEWVTNTTLNATLYLDDTQNPNLNLDFPDTTEFNINTLDITFSCDDILAPNLTYGLRFNGVDIVNGTYANATEFIEEVTLNDGINTLIASCYDFVNYNITTEFKQFYVKEISLIDESTGAALNLDNISLAKIYNDGNQTVYDFKSEATTIVNYTSTVVGKVRIVLGNYDIYGLGEDLEIVRWFDLSLFDESTIPVCGNSESILHYEQLPYASTEKSVIVKSMFAGCYVSGDYTRFAYQDALSLRFYTTQSLYYLSTINNGTTSYLASIDGGISTTINIDNLEFNKQGYNIDIFEDSLSIQEKNNATNELIIYYENVYDDLIATKIVIKQGTSTYFTTTETTSPTKFSINWDYSIFSDEINETSILTLTLTKYFSDGSTSELKEYFTPTGATGIFHPALAAVISVLLLMFGFTTTLTKTTFSWFGMGICLVGIVICTFALTAWYVYFVLVLNVICLLYCGIIATKKNYSEIG